MHSPQTLETMTTTRPCPLCMAHQAEKIETLKIIDLNRETPLIRNLVSCQQCDFVFTDEQVSQDDLDTHYADSSCYEDPEMSYGGVNDLCRERFLNIYQRVKHHLSAESRILDIGCVTGGLLHTFKEQGHVNLTGLDPSASCIRAVQKLGFQGIVGSIYDLQEVRNRYDMIICSHVLEHLLDPVEALKILKNHLNPDGVLYIEVPDAENYLNQYSGPYHNLDPQEHVNHFDQHSFYQALVHAELTPYELQASEIWFAEQVAFPVLYSLSGQQNGNLEPCPQKTAKAGVKAFITQSRQDFQFAEIDRWIESQEPIWVWGANKFAYTLLGQSRLGECNIQGFIDRNRSKHNKTLFNKPILGPEAFLSLHSTAPIYVTAVASKLAILDDARQLGLAEQLVFCESPNSAAL
jgi:SAM-dependent methyltransferase